MDLPFGVTQAGQVQVWFSLVPTKMKYSDMITKYIKALFFDTGYVNFKAGLFLCALPFSYRNLSIFLETQHFFKLKAKTQRKFKTQGRNSTILTQKLKVPEVFTT